MGKGKRNKSERKENYKDDIVYIIENHEILDSSNFWDIHQIMREDFYLLSALRKSLVDILIIENDKSTKKYNLIYDMDIDNITEKRKQFIKEIDKLTDKYKELDYTYDFTNKKESYNNIIKKNDTTEESSSYINPLNIHTEKSNQERFYSVMIECIRLSEKIEILCKEILYYLLKLNSHNNEILSLKEENLYSDFVYRKNSELFKFGLDTNIEQNKIINYEIICEYKNINDIISKKYELKTSRSGVLITKIDNRYINNILKERIINEHIEARHIYSKNIDIKKTNQIKFLNRILLYISVTTFAFQLLNLPNNYLDFYDKLNNYLTSVEINLLLILIFIGVIVILVISELTIFKDKKKYKEK